MNIIEACGKVVCNYQVQTLKNDACVRAHRHYGNIHKKMGVCEDIENAFSKTGFEGLYTTLFFDNENVRNLDSFAVGSVGIDSYWIFLF